MVEGADIVTKSSTLPPETNCVLLSVACTAGLDKMTPLNYGFHPTGPSLNVAQLECLQHSRREKPHSVRQARINRP